MDKLTEADIENYFTFHNPQNIPAGRFLNIRLAAKELGKEIIRNGGAEADIKLAIHKLRECVFYAIASIVVPSKDSNDQEG